jgi:hypothetical protein
MTEGLEFETYLRDRVVQYRGWYDKKAVTAKSRYLSMRAFTVVAGGLVPVLINLSIDTTVYGYSVKTGVVTLVSLLVVIAVSLESVFHYREQWKNYRSTEQLLSHEEFRYRAKIGAYSDLDEATALRTFVERCEDAISSENTATLNVMTLASEAADDKQRKHGAV